MRSVAHLRSHLRLVAAAAAVSAVTPSVAESHCPPPVLRRHDLAQASATLVVRDGGHVALRLMVPWAEVLFNADGGPSSLAEFRARAVAEPTLREFLVRVVAESPEQFARRVARVMAELERGTRVVTEPGDERALVHWQWPRAAEVQDALRRELMSRLAMPAEFEHASRLAVDAEQTFGMEITLVRLRVPLVLGPALLTVNRPVERWIAPGVLSAPIDVRRPRP